MVKPEINYAKLISNLLASWDAEPSSAPTTYLPVAIPKPNATTVHLDLKDWVDISRARLKRLDGEPFQEAYKCLQGGVSDGSIRVALSGSLYVETSMQVGPVRQRTNLADAMSELSRFTTLNARHLLLEAEIEAALHKRFGRPAFPSKPAIFGRGAHFAFSGKRFVASLERLARLRTTQRSSTVLRCSSDRETLGYYSKEWWSR